MYKIPLSLCFWWKLTLLWLSCTAGLLCTLSLRVQMKNVDLLLGNLTFKSLAKLAVWSQDKINNTPPPPPKPNEVPSGFLTFSDDDYIGPKPSHFPLWFPDKTCLTSSISNPQWSYSALSPDVWLEKPPYTGGFRMTQGSGKMLPDHK